MAEWKLNIKEVPVEHQKWEWDGNKYERFRQHISVAKVYRDGREQDVLAGDCFIQPAGTRHRIRNASDDEDLVFYVVANEVKNEKTERIIP